MPSAAILVVGEDPALLDFSATPPGVTAQSITENWRARGIGWRRRGMRSISV